MPPSKLSVVIPLYNKALHIERAVASVLSQSLWDFEVVVVDDGSSDEGAAIVKRMEDERIRLIQQANAGVSAARNRGILEARGELIAFLDADDEYKPEFLSVISDLAARHPTAGAYGTSFETVEAHGETCLSRTPSLRRGGKKEVLIRDYFEEALEGFVLCSSAAAVPRRAFAEVGLFAPGVSLGEDLDMWLRIGARFPLAVSAYVGAVYHRDAANRADVGKVKGFQYEHVKSGLRLLTSGGLGVEQREHLREYIAMFQLRMAAQMLLAGRREQARLTLRGCRTKRFILWKIWWQVWARIPTWAALYAQSLKRQLVGLPPVRRKESRAPVETAS